MLLFPLPGGSPLPLDRQIRYYSVTARLASTRWTRPELGCRNGFTAYKRGSRATYKTPPRLEWRFIIPFRPLASQVLQGDRDSFTVLFAVCPGWLSLCGPLLGGCSCRASAVLRAYRSTSSSRYITGAIYRAIHIPIERLIYFYNLRWIRRGDDSYSRRIAGW